MRSGDNDRYANTRFCASLLSFVVSLGGYEVATFFGAATAPFLAFLVFWALMVVINFGLAEAESRRHRRSRRGL